MSVELTRRGTRGTNFLDMPRWLLRVFHGMNLAMFRVAGSWMRIQGRPLLQLPPVGAKTGQQRKTTLGYFADVAGGDGQDGQGGESWLVVASAAGSAKHPAWYVNMAKNPGKVWVELGPEKGRVRQVRPESLKGEERAKAWAEVVRLAPGYGQYETQTDRKIPIVRLRPIE
jgi:deazaflavin-dependent oxidoreductase (nitroreductase family)